MAFQPSVASIIRNLVPSTSQLPAQPGPGPSSSKTPLPLFLAANNEANKGLQGKKKDGKRKRDDGTIFKVASIMFITEGVSKNQKGQIIGLPDDQVPSKYIIQSTSRHLVSSDFAKGLSLNSAWTSTQVNDALKQWFPKLFDHFASLDEPGPSWLLCTKHYRTLNLLPIESPSGGDLSQCRGSNKTRFDYNHIFLTTVAPISPKLISSWDSSSALFKIPTLKGKGKESDFDPERARSSDEEDEDDEDDQEDSDDSAFRPTKKHRSSEVSKSWIRNEASFLTEEEQAEIANDPDADMSDHDTQGDLGILRPQKQVELAIDLTLTDDESPQPSKTLPRELSLKKVVISSNPWDSNSFIDF
ncbi:hypothetical protein H0H93_016123 [Arthromyces matolae]|nr:hypothetical protein H0H93_016123 [Arthromyces matolae]